MTTTATTPSAVRPATAGETFVPLAAQYFNLRAALRMANLAQDAYIAYFSDDEFQDGYANLDGTWQQADSREQWLQRNHYQLIVDPNSETPSSRCFGIIAETATEIVVAFRGTAVLEDLKTDLGEGWASLGKTQYPFEKWNVGKQEVWAHRGFLSAYQRLRASVIATVETALARNRNATVYTTGHSLGAALATLCAVDLRASVRGPWPRLWTFASPRVGNEKLAALVQNSTDECHRVVNTRDWVPSVPDRGWTPAYYKWYYGGQHGPAPTPTFVDYQHVIGNIIEVEFGSATSPLEAHRLRNYYLASLEHAAVKGSSRLPKATRIDSLQVVLRTSNRIDAGGADDAVVRLLGVKWGPLTNTDLGYAAGSQHRYDLFARWPENKPYNPIVGDLTKLVLTTSANPLNLVEPSGWRPDSITVVVNGIEFATVDLHGYAMSWATTRTITCPLRPAP
ncbi:lipase family protein [Actinokineospora pegani]|uniref:lipase family protein n=1 Tax=Actinokineospora pegani TaxID=2654637 RepID=UPI0012EA2FEB|nr:lipase family protein [Actinokineospora pegani]